MGRHPDAGAAPFVVCLAQAMEAVTGIEPA